jgi:dipeptidyl aminopeptidase/acylaminoacyl peptidase
MKTHTTRTMTELLFLCAWGPFFCGLIAGGADVGTDAAARAKQFTLEHLNRMVRLSDPQIAPDGKSIALIVERADMETNRWVGELVLVDVATGEHRALTQGRKSVRHPRWSPTGDRLAFLAPEGSGKDAATQIFTLPMNGGEAQRITKSPTDVQHFSWRPDGKEIAFAAADEAPNKKEMEKGDDAFEVGNDDLFTTAAPMPVHIWLIPAGGGEAKRLTSGTWTLPVALPPSPPASPLSWSPDGRRIAFVRQETAHTGDCDKSAVQIIDISTGVIQPLTGQTLFESFPSFSPDGTKIVYWCNRDHDPYNVNDLFIARADGGAGTNLTQPTDRCFFQSRWLPDGKALLTGGHDGTRVALWLVPLEGKAQRMELGYANPSWSYWVDATVGANGGVAFTGSEANHPTELYYAPSASAAPRRLTDFNHEIAALELGQVEALEWSGPDGFHEDGVLVYPPGYQAGKKLPLVLYIHGGPQSASITSFSAPAQLLAARGYLVFSPNYRGSDNLGNVYQRAIFNDAGAGPDRDVMAGLDAVKAKGIVDESRIAVSGWSYGGYMTSWLIGHHSIWRAAVAGAAVTDLTDEYCFSDFNVQERYGFPQMATPWTPEGEKLYREQSPMTYARNVRTPTLILSDTGDARVPPTQSYRLYHALREQGVPVSMVAYPVPGHFPGDPVRSRDVWRRWAEWLDKYLQPEEAHR